MILSKQLSTTIKAIHHEKGEQWIQHLPNLLKRLEVRWGISFESITPFKLSYNLVLPAVNSIGENVVVKMSVPNKELESEADWLTYYKEGQVVKLLDFDLEEGILMMEQLRPGIPLSHEGNDSKAVEIAADLMKTIWREPKAGHSFTSIENWTKGLHRLRDRYNGGTGPFEERLVELAEERFQYLFTTVKQIVLLHGDLHQDNILSSEEGWKIIDQKGVIGEREVDIIPFLRNYLWGNAHPKNVLINRIDQFCELLDLNKERILLWGYSLSILSAWWLIEDGQSQEAFNQTMKLARLFDEIICN